ncbi:MAG TPA: phosphatase PAP2 family protein [Solirubrobacteraceae bacterium]
MDRRKLPLLAAAGCALGLVAVAIVGLSSDAGHARDVALLRGFSALDQSRFSSEIRTVARAPDPLPYAIFGLLCIAVALQRRRPWRALTVGVLLVATGLTTQALKHLLAEPRFAAFLGHWGQIEPASWPSGHSTAAMTLALCAVLVSPPAVRPVTALVGGAFAIGVGYATLALTWHYPSDVVGGFLVAGLWVSLAVAVLQRVEPVGAESARSLPWEPLAVLGGLGAVVAAIVVGAEAQAIAGYAQDRTTVVAGALAIAMLALALVATVSVATTGAARRARA